MTRTAPLALTLALLATGCSLAPAYHIPALSGAAPVAFKSEAGWAPAQPADAAPKGEWWQAFNDPVLDGYEARIAIDNNNVLAAKAQWLQARALVRQDRAALFPSIGLTASDNRSGNFASGASSGSLISSGGSVTSSGTTFSLTASGNWDVDLWGSIRNSVKQAQANAEADAGTLANATLSAQAEFATDYLQLRGIDAQAALSDQIVTADSRALTITRNKYAVGVDSRADIDQAQQTLDTAKSARRDLDRQRAELEDAIAVLLGENPANFHVAAAAWAPTIPEVPAILPGELLQRRPDVASAERSVAAANANIGIQRAAFFPTLSLSGSLGSTASALSNLFSAPTTLWSLGASAAETLLDWGARSAKVRSARAAYDAAAANYRETALTAFQQVEDDLAGVAAYRDQGANAHTSTLAAKQAETIAHNQTRAGTLDPGSECADVAAARQAEISELQMIVARQAAAVSLIEAIGGGWQTADLPK